MASFHDGCMAHMVRVKDPSLFFFIRMGTDGLVVPVSQMLVPGIQSA